MFTNLADIRFVTGVCSHVQSQLAFMYKCLGAYIAFKISYTGVFSHMISQIGSVL